MKCTKTHSRYALCMRLKRAVLIIATILLSAITREMPAQTLPTFPPISYEGLTATSTSDPAIPEFGTESYTTADYQALYENLLDWKGLVNNANPDLNLNVDLSQFDRPLHSGALCATHNETVFSNFTQHSDGVPAWQSSVSQAAKDRLRGLHLGRGSKMHGFFANSQYVNNREEAMDEVMFYFGETGFDLSETFVTPMFAGAKSATASAHATLLQEMLDRTLTKGYDIRNIEPLSEPYGLPISTQIEYQKECAIAVKNWFATNRPGVDYRVSLAVSRATKPNPDTGDGKEANALYLADAMRPYASRVSIHAYVFGNITRGHYDHTSSNIRDWAVGEAFGIANRCAIFAKLLRNEYGRPMDDDITRWLELGEWSAPKQEYLEDDASSGTLLSRDEGLVFRGMLGVMYKYLFATEITKIENVRNVGTWASAAGKMNNSEYYTPNFPKTGNGQMVLPDADVTTAHYWGWKMLQEHLGVAAPVIDGTTKFSPAGVSNDYYFGDQGPDVIGPFPEMVPFVTVNESQDKLFVIVANTNLTDTRNVSISLDGRNWSGGQPTLEGAKIIKAIENNTRDTWTGGRMEHGLLDANGGEIGGNGKFIDNYNVSVSNNVLSWADQPPFSIVYVELNIPVDDNPGAGGNLVQNPGFESWLDNWTKSGTKVYIMDNAANAYEGDRCLSVKWRSGDLDVAPGVSQVIDGISEYHNYNFSWHVWVKNMGVDAGLRIEWLDASNNVIGTPEEIGFVTGTDENWRNKTAELESPQGSQKVRVFVGFMEKDDIEPWNEARFDLVSVEDNGSVAPPPLPDGNLVQNPGFESWLDNWTKSGTKVYIMDNAANAYEGDRCLSVKWRSGDLDVAPGVSQVIDGISEYHNYNFSWHVWVKNMGVDAGLRIEWLDASNNVIGTPEEIGFVTGTDENWRNKTAELESPQGSQKVRVFVGFMEKDDIEPWNEARFDLVSVEDNGSVAPPPSDDPVIVNADFESSLPDGVDEEDGWEKVDNETPNYVYAATVSGHSGSDTRVAVIKRRSDGADRPGFKQIVSGIVAGEDYDFTYWVKTINLDDNTLVKIEFLDASHNPLGTGSPFTFYKGSTTGTTDWTEKSFSLTAPSGAVAVRIYTYNSPNCTTGEAQYDDFSITVSVNKSITIHSSENDVKRVITFDIYPNPANEVLHIIIYDETTSGSLQILDISGRTIYKGMIDQTVFSLDINHLPSGIYFIRLDTPNRQEIKRFTKN